MRNQGNQGTGNMLQFFLSFLFLFLVLILILFIAPFLSDVALRQIY